MTGGRPLRGRVQISGSKNAALKLLAAATLTGERCRFTNVPEIADVRVMVESLRDLGVVVDHPAPNTYEVAAGDVDWLFVPLEAAAKMRASFILLGPLLARFGRVIISNPGGDRIGRRPVNLHVDAMRALGADIDYRNGYYFARSPGRLRGAEIDFPAGDRDGHRERDPGGDARRRPHRPSGRPPRSPRSTTSSCSSSRWAPRSSAPRRTPSRSRAGAACGAPSTASWPTASRRARSWSRPPSPAARSPSRRRRATTWARSWTSLAEIGVHVACGRDTIEVTCAAGHPGAYRARDIETAPYPGLATDLQSPTAVLLTQANGTSQLHETIFEDRLEWMDELRRMGAQVDLHDAHHASITGPSRCTAPRSRWATCAPARR